MCYGSNNADNVTTYINAQLRALYENAVQCVKTHGDRKPEGKNRYSYALARFYHDEQQKGSEGSTEDTLLFAKFDKPTVDFACNHTVILRLYIKLGSYYVDKQADKDHNAKHQLPELEMKYQVPFQFIRREIPDINEKGSRVIYLFAFDYAGAKLSPLESKDQKAKLDIAAYMQSYLQLLQEANRHIFYSPSEFNDSPHPLFFDFVEAISDIPSPPVSTLLKRPMSDIEQYVQTSWTNASKPGSLNASDITTLANARIDGLSDGKSLHIEFACPEVRAICDQELAVIFRVKKVQISTSGSKSGTETKPIIYNCKIAVVAKVDTEKAETDNHGRLKMLVPDSSSGRCFPQHSANKYGERRTVTIPKLCDNNVLDEEAQETWKHVEKFITDQYLPMLEKSQNHFITGANSGVRLTPIPGDGEGHEPTPELYNPPKPAAFSQIGDTFGFDQIIVIPENALNRSFKELCTRGERDTKGDAALFYQWTPDHTTWKFDPLIVDLREDGNVYITVQVREGWFTANKLDHKFNRWSLVFECSIRHSVLSSVNKYTQSQIDQNFKGYRLNNDYTLESLYIDLTDAKHNAERFVAASDSGIVTSDIVHAVASRLHSHYFKELVSAGCHVLFTLPIWKSGRKPPPYALTLAARHVCTPTGIKGQDEAAIVIVGMCGHRAPPAQLPTFTKELFARAGNSPTPCTLSISARVIIEDTLLPQLAKVNTTSPVVPFLVRIKVNQWKLELKTLSELGASQEDAMYVADQDTKSDTLGYKWAMREQITVDRTGNYITNGRLTVICDISNTVHVHTTFENKVLTVNLEGDLKLDTSFKPESGSSVKTDASVHWDASLTVNLTPDKMQVKITSQPRASPKVSPNEAPKDACIDLNLLEGGSITKLLKLKLGTVDWDVKLPNGRWTACYPSATAFGLTSPPSISDSGNLFYTLQPLSSRPNDPEERLQAVGNGNKK